MDKDLRFAIREAIPYTPISEFVRQIPRLRVVVQLITKFITATHNSGILLRKSLDVSKYPDILCNCGVAVCHNQIPNNAVSTVAPTYE